MYKDCFKRLLDLIISICALVICSPLFIILIPFLLIANKGAGVVFTQSRTGKGGAIFKAIKFKTMTDERGKNGELLPDAQRLTKMGLFIRSLSIDELPQLINVIKGDMSLIGPRPLLPKYLPLYSQVQFRRHNVRPGITGWAQVNGRNNIPWSKKFEYDVWYVDNCSLLLDFKIIVLTIKKVLFREGVSKSGEVTTVAFDGTN